MKNISDSGLDSSGMGIKKKLEGCNYTTTNNPSPSSSRDALDTMNHPLSTRSASTNNNVSSKDTLDQTNQSATNKTVATSPSANKNGPRKRSITPEKRHPKQSVPKQPVVKPLFSPPILTSVRNMRPLTPERGAQQQQRAAATGSPNPILKKKNNSRSRSTSPAKQFSQPKPPPRPPSDAYLSESQTFNYWQSHELGLVPGVEVSKEEVDTRRSTRPRNLLQHLHSLRASRERTKDEIISHNDVENQQQHLLKLGVPLPTLHEEPKKEKELKNQISKSLLRGVARPEVKLNKTKSVKKNVVNDSSNNVSKQGQKHTIATNMHHSKSSHNIEYQPSHTRSSLYFILFLLSMICTLSLATTASSSNRTTTENTTLAFLIISTIVSFITSVFLKLTKTRSYLIKGVSLDIPHVGLFEFKSIVSLLSILLLICWGIVWNIISFNSNAELGAVNNNGHDGSEIWNANLYIGAWTSFGLVCCLFADGCVAPSDVTRQPQQDRQVQWHTFAAMDQSRQVTRNDIARGWMLNFIFSIILIATCGSTLNSPICFGGSILNESTLCERLRLSIVFGVFGIVLTLVYCGVRFVKAFHFEQSVQSNYVSNYNLWLFWNTRVDQVSFLLSIICATVFTLNAGFMTSSGSVGSNLNNVWLASWACFGLSTYLTLKHIDIFWSKQTSNRSSQKGVASGDKSTNKDDFPMIQINRRASCDTSAITDDETSASGTSYSVTCDEETGGTSYTSSDVIHI